MCVCVCVGVGVGVGVFECGCLCVRALKLGRVPVDETDRKIIAFIFLDSKNKKITFTYFHQIFVAVCLLCLNIPLHCYCIADSRNEIIVSSVSRS